jgi:hypothetical protein
MRRRPDCIRGIGIMTEPRWQTETTAVGPNWTTSYNVNTTPSRAAE